MTICQEQRKHPSGFAFLLYFIYSDWSAYVMLTDTAAILQLDEKIHIWKILEQEDGRV